MSLHFCNDLAHTYPVLRGKKIQIYKKILTIDFSYMENATCGLKLHGRGVKGKYMYVLFTWREVRKVTNCVRVLYLLVIAFVLNDQMLEGSRGDLCPLMKWYERNLCGKYCRITIPSLYPLLFCYSIHESILERTNLIL